MVKARDRGMKITHLDPRLRSAGPFADTWLPIRPATDMAMALSLETATPGDFAAVARQHRFQPFRDARALLSAVIAESKIKTGLSRKIGFQ